MEIALLGVFYFILALRLIFDYIKVWTVQCVLCLAGNKLVLNWTKCKATTFLNCLLRADVLPIDSFWGYIPFDIYRATLWKQIDGNKLCYIAQTGSCYNTKNRNTSDDLILNQTFLLPWQLWGVTITAIYTWLRGAVLYCLLFVKQPDQWSVCH